MNYNKINLLSSKKTAVLFLVFNRPDTTIKVFEKIREAKPSRLYVAADGPREGYSDEKKKVMKVRKIATNVDWPCEVKTLFRDKNLGCKKGVSTAITWFFEHEEQGIILEDDCMPHLDFFMFCENLLDRYSNDERISLISGNNFLDGKWQGEASYCYSKYTFCWGWATWRRSWNNYDGEISFWTEKDNAKILLNNINDKVEQKYWQKIFDLVEKKQIDSWAYPWSCCNFKLRKLSIIPKVNLVSNIGFGNDATHTKSKSFRYSNLSLHEISDIIHPIEIKRNDRADKYIFNNFYEGKSLRFPLSLLNIPKKIILFILDKIYFLNKTLIIKNYDKFNKKKN